MSCLSAQWTRPVNEVDRPGVKGVNMLFSYRSSDPRKGRDCKKLGENRDK